MYVCICHSVTDRQIREAAAQGAASVDDLHRTLGLAGTCGKCRSFAGEVLAAAREAPRDIQGDSPRAAPRAPKPRPIADGSAYAFG